jgi:hypothetical protein
MIGSRTSSHGQATSTDPQMAAELGESSALSGLIALDLQPCIWGCLCFSQTFLDSPLPRWRSRSSTAACCYFPSCPRERRFVATATLSSWMAIDQEAVSRLVILVTTGDFGMFLAPFAPVVALVSNGNPTAHASLTPKAVTVFEIQGEQWV